MKSERRHELRENDLIHFLHSTRDYFEKNLGRVVTIGAVVIVVLIVAGLAMRSQARAMEDVWKAREKLKFTDLKEGRESLETLKQITEGVTDKGFVMDSLMDQGRQALGLAQKVPDPPDRELTLSAQQSFQKLIEQFPDNPVALGVGLLGLANVEEDLFVLDGDLSHKEKARELLTRIIESKKLNGLPVQTVATKQREALDETFTRVTLASAPVIEEKAPAEAPAEAPAKAPAPTGTP